MTNLQTVIDPTSSSAFDFDMAKDSQLIYVNGGKYAYTSGSGVLGARGTYVYVDGNYNPSTVDYSPYLDNSVSNPWAYPGNKP